MNKTDLKQAWKYITATYKYTKNNYFHGICYDNGQYYVFVTRQRLVASDSYFDVVDVMYIDSFVKDPNNPNKYEFKDARRCGFNMEMIV